MTIKNGKTVYLQAVIVIDPATGWTGIHIETLAQADWIFNQVELI